MGTPFVSVAYEQKMKGFMKKIQQEKYCIDISDLSFELLKDNLKFWLRITMAIRIYLWSSENIEGSSLIKQQNW